MMPVIVTEAAGADETLCRKAQRRACLLGLPYYKRQGSLESMRQVLKADNFLVDEKNGPLYRPGKRF